MSFSRFSLIHAHHRPFLFFSVRLSIHEQGNCHAKKNDIKRRIPPNYAPIRANKRGKLEWKDSSGSEVVKKRRRRTVEILLILLADPTPCVGNEFLPRIFLSLSFSLSLSFILFIYLFSFAFSAISSSIFNAFSCFLITFLQRPAFSAIFFNGLRCAFYWFARCSLFKQVALFCERFPMDYRQSVSPKVDFRWLRKFYIILHLILVRWYLNIRKKVRCFSFLLDRNLFKFTFYIIINYQRSNGKPCLWKWILFPIYLPTILCVSFRQMFCDTQTALDFAEALKAWGCN